jgi:L-ascorbate metabolism protein UlaG (beta-lactamase superfamily)
MLEKFTWYKQSAYKWKGEGITVYIDPWGLRAQEEPADVIFITHAHADHFEPTDIEKIRKKTTQFVAPRDVAEKLQGNVKAIKPGEALDVAGIKFQTVPAYSTVEHRLQTHPKSNNWVGYILSLDEHRYWFSGDGDPNPDIEQVKTDVALI